VREKKDDNMESYDADADDHFTVNRRNFTWVKYNHSLYVVAITVDATINKFRTKEKKTSILEINLEYRRIDLRTSDGIGN